MPDPTLFPYLLYPDAAAAIEFLVDAFGFESVLVLPDDDGGVMHAELRFGAGAIMLGTGESGTAPGNGIYVYVEDPDSHHERAAAAGAEIAFPPMDTDFGARQYRAKDLAGNEWTFGTYRPGG